MKNLKLIASFLTYLFSLGLLILLSPKVQASLFQKGMGTKVFGHFVGSTIDLDVSKSYISSYVDFKKRDPIRRPLEYQGNLKSELLFYADQFKKTLIPQYILFEWDYYPLTSLGVFLKKDEVTFYENFNLGEENTKVNFIELMATRYEAPYSFSFFLGEIIPFYSGPEETGADEKAQNQSGSAVMGHVLTYGQKRLIKLDEERNHWIQYGYKIKGTYNTEKVKKKWTFELGYIFHKSELFFDGVIVNIIRDWATQNDPSLFANLKVEYSFTIPPKSRGYGGLKNFTTFQKFLIGRNYYFQKFVLGLDFGIRWEVYKGLGDKNFEETSLILSPSFSW